MQDVPDRDVEYVLVRELESETHVARFVRYQDDSGTISHGLLRIGIEFNLQILLNYWHVMRDVGWMTLPDAITSGLIAADAPLECTSSYCRHSIEPQVNKWLKAGMPLAEVNRRSKEAQKPISDWQDLVLWGG